MLGYWQIEVGFGELWTATQEHGKLLRSNGLDCGDLIAQRLGSRKNALGAHMHDQVMVCQKIGANDRARHLCYPEIPGVSTSTQFNLNGTRPIGGDGGAVGRTQAEGRIRNVVGSRRQAGDCRAGIN